MERLFDDAASIHTILPWIESEEEIVFFLRNIPIDQHHLRIQLALSHFFQLRDQSEENSEQNIEDDAREIVIILPDTPYNLIKIRLKELGNIPNRKEVLVKQLINERPELKRLVSDLDSNHAMNGMKKQTEELNFNNLRNHQNEDELNNLRKRQIDEQETNNFRKRASEEPESSNFRKRPSKERLDLDDLDDNKETNIKIKIRKVEGSLEVVSSIKQEYVSPKKMIRQQSIEEIVSSDSSSENLDYIPGVTVKTFAKNCTETTASVTKEIKNAIEVPEVFNLIEYLRDVTQSSEEAVRKACNSMTVPINERPNEMILNALLNILFDNTVDLDDTDSDVIDEGSVEICQMPVEFIPDEDVDMHVQPKDSTKDKPILKPATLLVRENGSASMPKRPKTPTIIHPAPIGHAAPIIYPARLNIPNKVISAIPPAFMDRITIRNGGTLDEPPNLKIPDTTSEEVMEPSTSMSAAPKIAKCDEKLVLRLIEMFPEACSDYIRKICAGKEWQQLDDLVTVILSEEEYPKRPQRVRSPPKEVDIDEQLEIVKALLPDADPTYLRWKCETIGNDTDKLNEFINGARETKTYPTMKEYLRKQKFSAQSKQYTTDFNVPNFVQLFPQPESTFRDTKRTVTVDNYTSLYICNFFQSRYDRLPVRTIRLILTDNDYRILVSDDKMKEAIAKGQVMKTRRKTACLQDPPQNIAVLQEIAYLTHKTEIEQYLKNTEDEEEQEVKFAKQSGLMNTCQCCYDDEVMPKNSFTCPRGCLFCRECIQKSCEVAVGDGKTEFKCLNDCSEEFALHTLQKVLPPKMFSKLAQKKALAEVKAAGIEELESCPFCDFASIPNVNDKIFRCLNPDCMKESCRLCKEENHVPYKCDELEKDEDVKARVFVENQMTEALLRKCWKCGTSFFKEEGCNKMTCTCGANMCYICKQPVKDYTHFNGIGGDKFHLCPLYSDTIDINQKNVIQAAEVAKSKVDPTKLKVDPSLDVQQHYENRKRQLPPEPHVQLLNDVQHQVQHQMLGVQQIRIQLQQELGHLQRQHQRRRVHHHRRPRPPPQN